MDVTLELGRYEFRAIMDEGVISLPAEVYISKNGLKFADKIQYSTLTEDKLKNIIVDPITLLGRQFTNERVLAHLINANNVLVPTSGNAVQIKVCDNSDGYLPKDVVAILLEQLMKQLRNSFSQKIENFDALLNVQIKYPIKYTRGMLQAYESAFESANLIVNFLTIDEILPVQDEHRDRNVLLLDIGYKSTRIYILRIGELPTAGFKHKVICEHEFNYGGNHFDILLYNNFLTKMTKNPVNSLEGTRIMKLCDKVKKELSFSTETIFEYKDFSLTIAREKFEKMIRRFVRAIFRKCKNMSVQNGVLSHYARGGCTLIPCINDKLRRYEYKIV